MELKIRILKGIATYYRLKLDDAVTRLENMDKEIKLLQEQLDRAHHMRKHAERIAGLRRAA